MPSRAVPYACMCNHQGTFLSCVRLLEIFDWLILKLNQESITGLEARECCTETSGAAPFRIHTMDMAVQRMIGIRECRIDFAVTLPDFNTKISGFGTAAVLP